MSLPEDSCVELRRQQLWGELQTGDVYCPTTSASKFGYKQDPPPHGARDNFTVNRSCRSCTSFKLLPEGETREFFFKSALNVGSDVSWLLLPSLLLYNEKLRCLPWNFITERILKMLKCCEPWENLCTTLWFCFLDISMLFVRRKVAGMCSLCPWASIKVSQEMLEGTSREICC